MKIDDWSFGKITIDGNDYSRDVIVFPDEVRENWWRKEGHSLDGEDLGAVLERKPAVFVMGCGYTPALTVPNETRRLLAEAGIEVRELPTPEACKELNRLFAEGEDAAGGLHLTC